jgi:imidazolonepropionase-like amidohydrolase
MNNNTALVLQGAQLVDGTGTDPVENGAVLVDDDGSIIYAGPAPAMPQPSGDPRRIDVSGHTVFPGFFDTHVHFVLGGSGESMYAGVGEPTSYRVLKIARRLQTTVQNGVTFCRDLMGLDVGFKQAVDAGLIPGPRLQLSITLLCTSGGHADFAQPNGFDPIPYILGPDSFSGVFDGVAGARRAARSVISAGGDLVKIATTGGVASPTDTPYFAEMTTDEARAIVEEAAARGQRRVAAHAEGRDGIQVALDAEVCSVEHGYELTDEQRAQMVEQGTFLVPTLSEAADDLDPAKVSASTYAKKQDMQQQQRRNIPHAVEAGIKIGAGTDTGLAPEHGHNLHEIVLLHEWGGMAPMDAVVAATRTSAQLCGVADTLGTLEAGKRADVVVIRGDPLSDLHLFDDPDNVALVLKDGAVQADRGLDLG